MDKPQRDLTRKQAKAGCSFFGGTVLELLDDLEKADAACATLQRLGYTYHGGEQWKPPLGTPPDFTLIDRLRAESDAWKSMALVMEQALRKHAPCGTCTYAGLAPYAHPCAECSDNDRAYGDTCWQFDEERFGGGERG